jgi:hypothetical protein
MLCKIVGISSRRIVTVMAAVSLITVAVAAPSAAYVTDGSVQKPPTTAPYAYGVFGPNEATFPKIGPIYGAGGDPRFGGTVRRITSEFPNPSRSDIYSKNGFWSADGRLMYHLSTTETKTIIDTRTGASVEVPGDYKGFDGTFAPDDPAGTNIYTWYYFTGTQLMKYVISIAAGGTLVASGPTEVRNFGVRLGGLGGSVDWVDSSGRYMVLNVNGAVKVWDGTTLYGSAQAVNADAIVAGGGWIGISPDGQYVVVSTEDAAGSHQQISYVIDHATGMVQAGKLFWTLCGGHGDLVSAADGKTYLVTFDCYGSRMPGSEDMLPAIYAVDVNPANAVRASNDPDNLDDEAGRNAQRASNRKLFDVAWGDDGHFSGVATGALRNWAFISIESGEDTFARSLDPTKRNPAWWTRPYMQEIVMVNVVTCQVARLAHHRSRSVSADYYYQPRVSATWDGTTAGWLSNFGQLQKSKQGRLSTKPYPGYADVYAVDITPADLPAPAPACLP